MEYEIKSISPTSVFKISFIVVLTVSCIFIFLLSLLAMSLLSGMGDSLSNIPFFEGMEPINFSFGAILLSSIFNGFLLTLFILLFIMLTVIFYNIYVSHIGGITIQIESSDVELVPQEKQTNV
jgi:hypothetical protein